MKKKLTFADLRIIEGELKKLVDAEMMLHEVNYETVLNDYDTNNEEEGILIQAEAILEKMVSVARIKAKLLSKQLLNQTA